MYPCMNTCTQCCIMSSLCVGTGPHWLHTNIGQCMFARGSSSKSFLTSVMYRMSGGPRLLSVVSEASDSCTFHSVALRHMPRASCCTQDMFVKGVTTLPLSALTMPAMVGSSEHRQSPLFTYPPFLRAVTDHVLICRSSGYQQT